MHDVSLAQIALFLAAAVVAAPLAKLLRIGTVLGYLLVGVNRVLGLIDKKTSMLDAFKIVDDVLRQGVQGISELITVPGLINVDFADVRTVMSETGLAMMGSGIGTGEHRARVAAEMAVSSPLLPQAARARSMAVERSFRIIGAFYPSTLGTRARSPNSAAIFRIHRGAHLAAERFGEGGELRDRSIDPRLRGGVGIDACEHSGKLRRGHGAPSLAEP